MALSRRDFVAGGAGLMAGAAFGVRPTPAFAQIDLGPARLDVVSDGSLTLPGGFIFDPMPQDELAPIIERFDLSADVLTPPCNVTLMRSGDRVVLFDVGSGPDFAPNAGTLLTSLEALDVTPEDVTDVIFTHAHPDHLWGLLDDFDDPLFSNASYMIGQTEWDYWMDPDTVDTIGDARASFAVGAQRRLEMIQDSIAFFKDGEEVLPGVAARATFGHTPGHMAFEVRSGSNAVMILGDCIGNHHVAFARPDWRSGSDQDQDLAAQTRVALMDQLAAEQMQVIGYHLPQGAGYVEKGSDGYTFTGQI
ncbi:MBL fold metallo-hydrolase [Sulfitobacter mediterraneus]|uniref:MBL fold metallo-hydrolase n=1 Tax=Sulfitobacter mediterraneus TaxID=83219 RepID=UPI00193A5DE4|nr:MBL fold metallo-hydrolase [Sulfitobacter mediterraneus]MBM1557557.1 MBL fold metallo-hydrolase [Sulfitobacter mediterraneus]MBM1569286.1 MBL fold metallo-hydrolase [Sulfitobacter mediterraneus]MBM1572730.1 MBL fold metallo-hydrolase [Sulfitobacter mediterraneus]MBM1576893.1 MBL fold metallo-hydrolase [Sulfitobacter mediterraneus]MBM1580607.1 MBL fold metallo-hydrolase [Sulfitobacter mediterraneus]